jgi:DNA-binding CsgD family transcriptional regulator/PAS domain-containing protein
MHGHPEGNLGHLAEALYDAAMEPSLWTPALDRLGDALGGSALVMGMFRKSELVFYAANRLDPERDSLLHDHYSRPQTNPFLAAMPRLPLLTVVERNAIIGDHDYVASGLFNDVFRRQKLIHAASACLARQHGLMVTNGVLRRASGEFSSDHRRIYQAILPHLRRAIGLAVRMHDLESVSRRAAAAADLHPDGLVIVDPNRRVRFCNTAAERALVRGDGIYWRDGVLHGRHSHDDGALARLIRGAALRTGLCGGGLRVTRGGEAPDLALIVTPFPPDLLRLVDAATPQALVTITELALPSPPDRRHVADLFGFSKAETELAIGLLEGKHLEEIALERHVALSTVRSQLRSILRKTGLHRQGELVQLLRQVPVYNGRSQI